MLIEHPELKARLRHVLGEGISGLVYVQSLKLCEKSATIELKIQFKNDEIPPNFKNKSKNCLVFLLDVPDFTLEVGVPAGPECAREHQFIRSNKISFFLGRHQYKISAEAVFVVSLQSINEMDLVDREW